MPEGMSESDAIAAIAALEPDAEPVEAEQPEAPDPEAEEPEQEAVEAEGGAEEDASDAEEEQEDDDEEVEEASAVDAPHWWDAEAKEHFANIPKNAKTWALKAQLILAEQEAKREAITAKEKSAAIETRKQASEASEAMRGLIDKLQSSIPDEVAAFHARHNYDPQDLERYRHEDPAGYLALQAQIHAERTELERKISAKAEAERVAAETFAREQADRLREIQPELAKPESIKALADYLPKTGIAAAALSNASAEELVILNKARLWDELQAKAAASVNAPKPRPHTPVKSIKPVAAQTTGTHQQRQFAQAKSTVFKTGKDADAIAAIMAGGL